MIFGAIVMPGLFSEQCEHGVQEQGKMCALRLVATSDLTQRVRKGRNICTSLPARRRVSTLGRTLSASFRALPRPL